MREFSLRDKIGYALGDLGNNFSFALVTSFLLVFYTNILKINPGTVALLFLIARLVDAVADVSVGILVDKLYKGHGNKFINWINLFKWPLAIFTSLIFLPSVQGLPDIAKLLYAFFTYLIWGINYSAVNIPYGAMSSSIGTKPSHASSLSLFRSIGSAIGSIIVSVFVPLMIYGPNQSIHATRFWVVATAMGVMSLVAYTLTTRLVTERVHSENKVEKIGLKKTLGTLFKSRSLIALVLVDLIVITNNTVVASNVSYVYHDYFATTVGVTVGMVINFATVFIIAPFSDYLTKRFGRKEITEAGLLFAAVMYGILFLIHTHNIVIYLVIFLFASIGVGIFNVMIWALISDVINDFEIQTGNRAEGTVYSVNSFARKSAQALGGALAAWMLGITGYTVAKSGDVHQTAEVLDKVYQANTLTPTILLLIAGLCLIFIYPLKKQRVLENDKKLNND